MHRRQRVINDLTEKLNISKTRPLTSDKLGRLLRSKLVEKSVDNDPVDANNVELDIDDLTELNDDRDDLDDGDDTPDLVVDAEPKTKAQKKSDEKTDNSSKKKLTKKPKSTGDSSVS